MHSIFYDFETTDTSTLGQILNYSFIAVDEDYSIISELSGLIHISRLQLPSPGAMLANRVDILEHQKRAKDSEKVATRKISEYLWEALRDSGGDVRLIGFNSSKFDLAFLRTTFIRNGLNPYLRNGTGTNAPKLLNGDLLHVARKLVTTNEEFALISLKENESGELKRSLTLQHLSQQLGLLTGEQLHESRADVLLTIELARTLHERFGIDVRTFRPYEGVLFHKSARTGKVFLQRIPEYDLGKETSYSVSPVTLLDYKASGALWIDLAAYQNGETDRAILWRNTNDGWFFVENAPEDIAHEYHAIALQSLEKYSTTSMDNYFSKSTCDIEADIYRLDFDAKDMIGDAIWKGEKLRQNATQDAKIIMTRFRLANYEWGNAQDEKMRSSLREYALYRYGGRAITSKSYSEGDDVNQSNLHPTFSSFMRELEEKLQSGSNSDKKILSSLKQYYLESDIFKVCGEELMAI